MQYDCSASSWIEKHSMMNLILGQVWKCVVQNVIKVNQIWITCGQKGWIWASFSLQYEYTLVFVDLAAIWERHTLLNPHTNTLRLARFNPLYVGCSSLCFPCSHVPLSKTMSHMKTGENRWVQALFKGFMAKCATVKVLDNLQKK